MPEVSSTINNSNNNNANIPSDCTDIGSIIVKLPTLAALDDLEGNPKPVSSATYKIGGLTWRMEVHKKGAMKNGDDEDWDKADDNEKAAKPAKLDLYIYCNEDVKDYLWLCKVLFTVHSGTLEPEHRLTYSYNHFYGFNTYYWILLDIFDQECHEMSNGPIEIKLDLKIYRTQKSLPSLDTNLVVNIGDNPPETLPINKHTLAGLSSYFRNLFFEDWCEKKQGGTHFELNETEEGFDMEAFKFMIYSAMTMGWMVHESNFLDYSLAVEIVKLGIKYDVLVLVDYCEKFLIQTKNIKMEILELAEQYSLTHLKEHCLNAISLLDYMEEFGKSSEIYSRLSKQTQEQLQAKLSTKATEAKGSLAKLGHNIRVSEQVDDFVEPYNRMASSLMGQKACEVAALSAGDASNGQSHSGHRS